jgi:hypothetical protein
MNGGEMRPDAMTDTLLAQLLASPAVAPVNQKNYAVVNHGGSQNFTAPSALAVLAVGGGAGTATSGSVRARTTGVFVGMISFSWTDSATADTLLITISSNTTTAGGTTAYTGGTTIGLDCYIASTATTPLAGLVGVGAVTQFTGKGSAATAALSNTFSWQGLIYNASGTVTMWQNPFPIGNVVGLSVALTAFNSVNIIDVSMSLWESPIGIGLQP